jgi:hypothetical protein
VGESAEAVSAALSLSATFHMSFVCVVSRGTSLIVLAAAKISLTFDLDLESISLRLLFRSCRARFDARSNTSSARS